MRHECNMLQAASALFDDDEVHMALFVNFTLLDRRQKYESVKYPNEKQPTHRTVSS